MQWGGVCPPADEKQIIALESATKCCGYSLYTSHTWQRENVLIWGQTISPRNPPQTSLGEEEGKKNFWVELLHVRPVVPNVSYSLHQALRAHEYSIDNSSPGMGDVQRSLTSVTPGCDASGGSPRASPVPSRAVCEQLPAWGICTTGEFTAPSNDAPALSEEPFGSSGNTHHFQDKRLTQISLIPRSQSVTFTFSSGRGGTSHY